MNGQDWDLCRNRLIARGITEFTDGDVIAEYEVLNAEREAAVQAAGQELWDSSDSR